MHELSGEEKNYSVSQSPQQLIERLRALVRQIMQESDPLTYDELAAEIWRILDQIEHQREMPSQKRAA
jgi:hypothetical protein